MESEALTVTAALRGLAQSCKAIRKTLTQLRARRTAMTTSIEATLEELSSLDMALPAMSKHIDNDQCIRNITIDELVVVLAASVKNTSVLESYCEDLLSANDAGARRFHKDMLDDCNATLKSKAEALQPTKMAILLTLQLMTASPNEPAPVLERKRHYLCSRIQDILAQDSILAGRVSTDLAMRKEPSLYGSPSTLSQIETLQSQSSITSRDTNGSTKSVWRTLFTRAFSSSSRSPSADLRPLSIISKWSGSCSSGASACSVATSQTSISIDAPAGGMKLPIAPEELTNGHHYLSKPESAHSVRDFAAQSATKQNAATYQSFAEVSKLLPNARRKHFNGSPPRGPDSLQLQCAKNRSRLRTRENAANVMRPGGKLSG